MRKKKATKAEAAHLEAPNRDRDLVSRIEKLRAECEAALDELSERGRPSVIPAVSIRQMLMARGGFSVFEAVAQALKGK